LKGIKEHALNYQEQWVQAYDCAWCHDYPVWY
jgi:hypothetical protein